MKIKYDLEYCHGIKKMDYEFDFNGKHIIVIHSPNGTMKTSLCKTTQDLIEGKDSKDFVDTSKVTKRNITINGNNATKNQVRVFTNYQNANIKESIARVMLTNVLRTKYDAIVLNEKLLVDTVIQKLSSSLGIQPKTTEQILENIFPEKGMSLILLSALKNINKRKRIPTFSYSYKDLFNPQAKTFFTDNDVKDNIGNYTRYYNKLIKKSTLFTSGLFDLSNLTKISINLKDNNFFEGKNQLLLNGCATPITNYGQLEKLIEDEINKIGNNPIIVKKFKTIMDKNISSNKQVTKIFDFFKKDFELARGYKDYADLEKMFILSKISGISKEIKILKIEHRKNRNKIGKILKAAEKTKTIWEKVIPDFISRFNTRFDINIVNKTNHILGFEEPIVEFTFDSIKAEENNLKEQVFCTSEDRAYHMLQILLEIELIKEEGKDVIILFDDIADSYDYSNKLVIIQYLEEITHIDNVYVILLTHNFDFYRSVGLKIAYYQNCFFANKTRSEITIENGKYLQNVFSEFKGKIGVSIKATIAIVPFARNLLEYSDSEFLDNCLYLFYTKFVHYRPHGSQFKISSLIATLEKQFNDHFPSFTPNSTIYSSIDTEAKTIATQTIVSQTLEDKMIITIALRIRCEKYMYKKILKVDSTIKDRIDEMEMGKLLEEFKTAFPNNKNIDLLCSIDLLVPTHIHVNNFMYEPMIDYSIDRFRQLFNHVVTILK
jgi:hypothetical protein